MPPYALTLVKMAAKKIVREHVIIVIVHMTALLTVITLALQGVVHVVIVAIESVHIVVRETVQLIVRTHVLKQKYSMTQKEKNEKLEIIYM